MVKLRYELRVELVMFETAYLLYPTIQPPRGQTRLKTNMPLVTSLVLPLMPDWEKVADFQKESLIPYASLKIIPKLQSTKCFMKQHT